MYFIIKLGLGKRGRSGTKMLTIKFGGNSKGKVYLFLLLELPADKRFWQNSQAMH